MRPPTRAAPSRKGTRRSTPATSDSPIQNGKPIAFVPISISRSRRHAAIKPTRPTSFSIRRVDRPAPAAAMQPSKKTTRKPHSPDPSAPASPCFSAALPHSTLHFPHSSCNTPPLLSSDSLLPTAITSDAAPIALFLSIPEQQHACAAQASPSQTFHTSDHCNTSLQHPNMHSARGIAAFGRSETLAQARARTQP